MFDIREGPNGQHAIFWDPSLGGTIRQYRVLLIDADVLRDITGTPEERYYLDL